MIVPAKKQKQKDNRRNAKKLIKVADAKKRLCPDCNKRLYPKPDTVDRLFCAKCGEEFDLDDTPVQTRIIAANKAKPILLSRKTRRPLDPLLQELPAGAAVIDQRDIINGR